MKASCVVCAKIIKRKPSEIIKLKGPVSCSMECRGRYISAAYLGSKNPNKSYNFDESYFSNIDTEEKAYFLGWIASDGSLRKSGFSIQIHKKDKDILLQLRDLVCKSLPIQPHADRPMVTLTVNSQQMSVDICRHLGIAPGKKSHTVMFPNLKSQMLNLCFVRGFFDGDGFVKAMTTGHRTPSCGIATSSEHMRKGIADTLNVPYWTDHKINMEWSGNNALDVLSKLYDYAKIKLKRKYELYESVCTWVPSKAYSRYWKDDNFQWAKSHPDAVAPFKARASDSGYDLTLIKKIKETPYVDYYDTGIKIKPAFGIYFMLVARSSLHKYGYSLANSVGILDRSYLGTIVVALWKTNRDAPELPLPGRYVQIVPTPIIHFEIEEVSDLGDTSRGSNGFGSTGK